MKHQKHALVAGKNYGLESMKYNRQQKIFKHETKRQTPCNRPQKNIRHQKHALISRKRFGFEPMK